MYTTTINQNGMILLNKAAREALGVKLGDRVMIRTDKKRATVEREMTGEEARAYMDSLFSAETKKRIKENAGKTVREMMDEWRESDEFRKEMEKEYGAD